MKKNACIVSMNSALSVKYIFQHSFEQNERSFTVSVIVFTVENCMQKKIKCTIIYSFLNDNYIDLKTYKLC